MNKQQMKEFVKEFPDTLVCMRVKRTTTYPYKTDDAFDDMDTAKAYIIEQVIKHPSLLDADITINTCLSPWDQQKFEDWLNNICQKEVDKWRGM
jgi:hypothetical protein